ncbi:MAG TPA: TlpA disulfide reductase family protein [Bacilli bacterium]|nr:TlpA disulfide reductase family protein [Bacilli bacterium]
MQPRSYTRPWSLLLTATLVLALVLLGCARPDEGNTDTETTTPQQAKELPPGTGSVAGQLAPDFTLTTLSNHDITLSQLRGKKVFLNFFASWCGPCKEELPDLLEMSRQYEGQIQVYGVNLTAIDTPQDANKMAMEYKLTYPIVLDMDGLVQKNYRVVNVPTSFAIDETGHILARWEGYMPRPKMEQLFKELADSKPTATTTAGQ